MDKNNCNLGLQRDSAMEEKYFEWRKEQADKLIKAIESGERMYAAELRKLLLYEVGRGEGSRSGGANYVDSLVELNGRFFGFSWQANFYTGEDDIGLLCQPYEVFTPKREERAVSGVNTYFKDGSSKFFENIKISDCFDF